MSFTNKSSFCTVLYFYNSAGKFQITHRFKCFKSMWNWGLHLIQDPGISRLPALACNKLRQSIHTKNANAPCRPPDKDEKVRRRARRMHLHAALLTRCHQFAVKCQTRGRSHSLWALTSASVPQANRDWRLLPLLAPRLTRLALVLYLSLYGTSSRSSVRWTPLVSSHTAKRCVRKFPETVFTLHKCTPNVVQASITRLCLYSTNFFVLLRQKQFLFSLEIIILPAECSQLFVSKYGLLQF